MKNLQTTDVAVRIAAKRWPQSKSILKELFHDAFPGLQISNSFKNQLVELMNTGGENNPFNKELYAKIPGWTNAEKIRNICQLIIEKWGDPSCE